MTNELAQPNDDDVKVFIRDTVSTRHLIEVGVFKQAVDYTQPRQLANKANTDLVEDLRVRTLKIVKEITDAATTAA